MSDAADREPTTRVVVTGGGTPTPEQLAALTVVLSAARPAPPAPRGTDRSGWERAALLEGVGFRPFGGYPELQRYHRSIA